MSGTYIEHPCQSHGSFVYNLHELKKVLNLVEKTKSKILIPQLYMEGKHCEFFQMMGSDTEYVL